MSIYMRKKSKFWQIEFQFNGKTIRRSSGTTNKEEAEQKEAALKRQLWQERELGVKPKRSWDEAVLRHLKEKKHKKSYNNFLDAFRVLTPYFRKYQLQELTRTVIDEELEQVQDDREITNARINRLASYIRTMLNNACYEWEWIDKAPKIRMREEGETRIRWITKVEAHRLISMAQNHYARIIQFALLTGLRKKNILHLKWNQIDMQRHCAWIYADQAKGKRNISVPLTPEAIELLRSCIGEHQTYVFTLGGKPVSTIDNKAWKALIERAGITDFRFHDLRHTWASWHVMAGTPLQVLKELGGWSDIKMVLRYAHLSSDHLQDAARNVSVGYTPPQNSTHPVKISDLVVRG